MNVLVFVVSIGNISYKNDAEEILKDYFNYNKINYFFLEENPKENIKNAHPSWLKLISHKIYPTDDFVLCWDLDLLPIDNSKNIIEFLDFDKLNMCYDSSVLLTSLRFTPNFKYNGGLIGIPPKYRKNLEDIYDKYAPGTWPSYEQYYLNEEIFNQNLQVNILNPTWNSHYPKAGSSDFYFKNAFNKHYTWGITTDADKSKFINDHRYNYFARK